MHGELQQRQTRDVLVETPRLIGLRRGDGSGGLPSSIENRGMGHLRKLLDEMLHQQVRASAADMEESYG